MHLYNSLTRKKEPLIELEKGKIKLYVCGITPYDTTHLGHAFTYITFDVLIRYLQFSGYQVTYTQNVTDIDDDILQRSKLEGKDWKELGDFWTKRFLQDLKNLNVLRPQFYVKATDSIPTIIRMVKNLIEENFAYEKNGNVYFEVTKFEQYGKLSQFTQKQMTILLKERGGNPEDPRKKHPLDFILWVKSKQGEPSWESPWGRGRPGWHIECSAMNYQYGGSQIDIHGGGRDLIFPHHESEIAQSESFTGKRPFAKYWMHTAMLMYEGEKMSKSLGNLVLIKNLLKKYTANEIRWVLLSHHYRSPWEFYKEELDMAHDRLSLISRALKEKSEKISETSLDEKFYSYLDDDINTPDALSVIVKLAKERRDKKMLQKLLRILGFAF